MLQTPNSIHFNVSHESCGSHTAMRWLLACWFALWGIFTLPALASEPTPVNEVRRIVTQGDRLISDEVVSLPDRLVRTWRNETLRIAYEFVVHPSSTATQGLWLFRAGAPYRLFLNGQPASPFLPLRRAPPDREVSLNGRSPALFVLPNDTVNVRIEFLTLPFMPVGLVELRSGPLYPLTLKHLERYESAARPVFISGAVASTLGILLLLLWVIKRSMKVLLFIAFMCLCIALRDGLYSSSQLPLPALVFEQANPFLIMCFAVTAQAVTLTLINRLTREKNRLLWGIVSIMTLLYGFSLAHPPSTMAVRSVSLALSNGGLFVIIALLWLGRSHLSRFRVAVLSSGYFILLASSLHDLGMLVGFVPPTQGTMLVWGFLALLLAFSYTAVEFVFRNLSLAENTNLLLEQKVIETTQALEKSYQALAINQSREARRQERVSIMRDMHDGVGSFISSAILQVQQKHLKKDVLLGTMRDALDQLKLSVDVLSIQEGDVNTLLASLRYRLEPRLKLSGINLVWAVDALPILAELKSQHLRHLQFVLYEALSNVLQHARAQTIRIEAKTAKHCVSLTVSDNGRGFLLAGSAAKGLMSMRERCGLLGGELHISSTPDRGTLVRVLIAYKNDVNKSNSS